MTLAEASDYSRAAAHPSVFGILHCSLHKEGGTVLHSIRVLGLPYENISVVH